MLIRCFDLKTEGQGHEEQCGVSRYYMTNCVAYNLFKNPCIYLKPLVCASPSNHTCINYISSAMLKIGNFQLTLKLFIKVAHVECQNNKSTQWSSSRKRGIIRLK